jgi:hypothetical protein
MYASIFAHSLCGQHAPQKCDTPHHLDVEEIDADEALLQLQRRQE